MAKYSFKCIKCGTLIQKYVSMNTKQCLCECGKNMDRQMPNIGSIQTNELVDKYMGKSLVANHKDILNARKQDYYWNVEVPNMVNSGTYTPDTMLEKDWVYYNEKGELVTRTKPPQRS